MTERAIPAPAIAAAVELAQLFERDRELVLALNAAQDRLLRGTDRLTSGLSAEALKAVYGPAGPDLGLSGRPPEVLQAEQPIAALQEVADTIRSAFIDYQDRGDDRRILAMDVGEANVRLIAALSAAGFTEQEARSADVHALADGRYAPAREERQ